MEIFKKNTIFDFVKWSKYGLFMSILFTFISLYLFFGVGFNLGIDFSGGSSVKIQYKQNDSPNEEIRHLLAGDSRFNNY